MNELSKPQWVRILDIVFIGPFLMKLSQNRALSDAEKALLLVIGAGTVFYNGYYFMQNLKKEGR